jgi:hypothetical protein
MTLLFLAWALVATWFAYINGKGVEHNKNLALEIAAETDRNNYVLGQLLLVALRNGATPSQLTRDYIEFLAVDTEFGDDSSVSQWAADTLIKLAKQYHVPVPANTLWDEDFLDDLIDAMTVAIAREARHPRARKPNKAPVKHRIIQ